MSYLGLRDKDNLVFKMSEVEKQYILEVYSLYNGNKTHTAKALGIGIRTLQRKLKKWNNQ